MKLLTSPFGRIYTGEKNEGLLDAIYILTLADRKMPSTNLEWLLHYTKEVVLLFSSECAEWVDDIGNKVRVERVNNTGFYEKYMKRPENNNISIKWRTNFDIPLKRSYALQEAKEKGFKHILLLDDDIYMSNDNMKSGLSGLVQGMTIIGFHVVEYPDVSTLDHIERIIYKKSNIISMTGSCMFINVDNVMGEFPLIYNEDLFFFMKQINAEKVVSGGTVLQSKYQPWKQVDRVKHEQFGDLIYEAIKRKFIDMDYTGIEWGKEIEKRLNRINLLKSRNMNQMYDTSLEAAYVATREIEVKDIQEFITNNFWADWVKKYF